MTPEKKQAVKKRPVKAASKTEDAFLAAIDDRLKTVNSNLVKAQEAVAGAKRRSWGAVIVAVVALLLGGDGLYLHKQLANTRKANRQIVCQNFNKQSERDAAQAQALLDASALSRRQPGKVRETPEQVAQREEATRLYVEQQGFAYVNGKVVPDLLDCTAFLNKPKGKS